MGTEDFETLIAAALLTGAGSQLGVDVVEVQAVLRDETQS